MEVDVFSLKCFIKVVETRSFTKAAACVGRTQSALSQQIGKLEGIFGKPLIERGKQVRLTPDGEVFLGYARKIVALYAEALDRFKEPELEGELRFGLPEDFASVFLSEVLADFSRIHPRILLHVECDLTVNLYKRFKQREFDLVMVKMHRPQEFPNGVKIWSESLKWVGDSRLLEQDKPVPLVLAHAPCVYRQAALDALEASGRSWRLVFSGSSYAVTIAAIEAGMGISVMPYTLIPKGVEIIDSLKLPSLIDMHVSLLKHTANISAVNSLEKFVMDRLKR